MSERTRKSGLGIIEDISWGTHFCQFYQTKEELLDILVPYFKAGLENNEFCLWITAEPLDKQEALEAFSKALPNFEQYLKKGQIEIIPHDEWYLKDGTFNPDRVLNSLTVKLHKALTAGYDGLRFTANTSLLERKYWREFKDYEAAVENIVDNCQMLAVCSYRLDSYKASDFLDVVSNHQLAVIKKDGNWGVIESNGHKQGALQVTEEKLRVMFDTVPVAIAVTDLNGKVLDVNETAVHQGGFNTKMELIGQNSLQMISPGDVARAKADLRKILVEGNVGASEYTLLRKDGTEFIGELSASFIRDISGKPTAITFIIRDISEHKRTDKALLESEERFHSLVNNIPDVVWTATSQGNIIFISHNIEAVTGYSHEDVCQGGYPRWLDRIHPDDAKIFMAEFGPQLEKGMPWEVEYRFRRKDGHWIWLHTSTTHPYKKGSITYIDGITTDITVPKRIKEALQKSEAEYRLLVENANDGIMVIHDGVIRFANRKVTEITGYSNKELTSAPFIGFFKSNDSAVLLERHNQRLKGEQLSDVYTFQFVDKNGNNKWLEARAVLISWENRPATLNFITDITDRKLAEEVLRYNEIRFRELANLLPEGVFELDLEGAFTFANHRAFDLSGYSQEDVDKGLNVRQVITPGDIAKMEQDVALVMAGEDPGLREYTLLRKDGSKVPSVAHASRIVDYGKVVGLRGIVVDITARKQAEEALRKSEEKLRVMFQTIADGIIIVDPKGNIMELNEAASLMSGYSKEEIIGHNSFHLLAHKDLPRATELSKKIAVTAGTIAAIELTCLKKDGTELPIEVSSALMKDADGNPTAMVCIVRNITERKRLEEALQKSEEEYRLLVENANEGIVVACDDKLCFANTKLTEIYKYSMEELISKPIRDLIYPDDRHMVQDRHRRTLASERISNTYATRIINRDGNITWVEINGVLISWKGKPATLNFVNDITERKQLEEQLKDYSDSLEKMVDMRTQELREAQEKLVRTEKLAAIGQLAGSVSHELRNPLAAIRASAFFLKAKLGNTADDMVRNHLSMLDTQVGVCDKIITDILGLARMERPKVAEIDINHIIQEQVNIIDTPNNLEISTCLANNLPGVMADSGQLERVLSNLVSNAIQAMPYGGRLIFSTNQKEDFVEVKVTDTGEGITQENLGKVFEPLFTTKAKGVGLGLSISRAMIEKQGGTIDVESQIGQSTTFTIRLPIIGRRDNSNG